MSNTIYSIRNNLFAADKTSLSTLGRSNKDSGWSLELGAGDTYVNRGINEYDDTYGWGVLQYTAKNGIYGGLRAENVSLTDAYPDGRGTLFAGINRNVGRFGFNLEAAHTQHINLDDLGDLDDPQATSEITGEVMYRIAEPVSFGIASSYSPDYRGEGKGLYHQAFADVNLFRGRLGTRFYYGRQEVDHAAPDVDMLFPDHDVYGADVNFKIAKGFAVQAGWSGTDLDQSLHPGIGDDTFRFGASFTI